MCKVQNFPVHGTWMLASRCRCQSDLIASGRFYSSLRSRQVLRNQWHAGRARAQVIHVRYQDSITYLLYDYRRQVEYLERSSSTPGITSSKPWHVNCYSSETALEGDQEKCPQMQDRWRQEAPPSLALGGHAEGHSIKHCSHSSWALCMRVRVCVCECARVHVPMPACSHHANHAGRVNTALRIARQHIKNVEKVTVEAFLQLAVYMPFFFLKHTGLYIPQMQDHMSCSLHCPTAQRWGPAGIR